MTLDTRLRRLEVSQDPDCLTCAAPNIIRFYALGNAPQLPLERCPACGRLLPGGHSEVWLPENDRSDTWNDG